MTHLPRYDGVEDDSDQGFTAMPKICGQWVTTDFKTLNGQKCGGKVKNIGGFMRCDKCYASFGPAKGSK